MPKTPPDSLDSLCAEIDGQDYQPELRPPEWKPASATLAEIRYHAHARYWQFTPTYSGRFEERLWKWVSNAALTQDQKNVLLRMVPELQFVDRDDLLSLYRAAFQGPISRWLLDATDTSFSTPLHTRQRRIKEAIRHTWFCPVTDSMDISQFLHVNEIAGADQRPPWRVLKRFSSRQKLKQFCREEQYHRVVILEDFVGSGTQVAGPLKYATEQLGPSIPILFVPLIISKPGIDRLMRTTRGYRSLRVEPVFVVPRHVQVPPTPAIDLVEDPLWEQVRDVVNQTFPRVCQSSEPDLKPLPLKDAFGFGRLGMLLVLYTNCPNNTLPLIWHSNQDWHALFPRVSRKD